MVTQSIQTVAGVVIPDAALVREVTDFIRNAEDELLFDHSRRVFLFGALAAFTDGMKHRPRTTFGHPERRRTPALRPRIRPRRLRRHRPQQRLA